MGSKFLVKGVPQSLGETRFHVRGFQVSPFEKPLQRSYSSAWAKRKRARMGGCMSCDICSTYAQREVPTLPYTLASYGLAHMHVVKNEDHYLVMENEQPRFKFFVPVTANRDGIEVENLLTLQPYLSIRRVIDPDVDTFDDRVSDKNFAYFAISNKTGDVVGNVICRMTLNGERATGATNDDGKRMLDHINLDGPLGSESGNLSTKKKKKIDPKGLKTYEYSHFKRGLFTKCECLSNLEDVTYSLVEIPVRQCCTGDVHLAGYSRTDEGSLKFYGDFDEITPRFKIGEKPIRSALNLQGYQRGGNGDVFLDLATYPHNRQLDQVRFELLACVLAHWVHSPLSR